MQKLRSVQILRAVAACAVVALHCYPEPHAPVGNAGYGAFGVDLFFVISGFIMAQVSQARSADSFLRDRLWRIYPLWWIALVPWVLMLRGAPLFIASSVTLWPIYFGHYYTPLLGVGWTLSFELLFYFGIALALATRPLIPLATYAVLLVGSLTSASPLLHLIGSPMGLEFLMGLAIAQLPRRTLFVWLVPAGLSLVALTSPGTGDLEPTIGGYGALQRSIEWGLPAALIVCGTLSIEPVFEQRMFRLPIFLGDASYSIYLFHPLIAFGFSAPWPVRAATAIALGCTMHLLVERRIMAAKRLTMKRHQAVGAASFRPGMKGTFASR